MNTPHPIPDYLRRRIPLHLPPDERAAWEAAARLALAEAAAARALLAVVERQALADGVAPVAVAHDHVRRRMVEAAGLNLELHDRDDVDLAASAALDRARTRAARLVCDTLRAAEDERDERDDDAAP